MIVAIHQPQYLPWLPYFDKADDCDVFVHLDNVQFQKNGVQNRNRIKTANGETWLTVPVHASLACSIEKIPIASEHWAKKHIRSIELNYENAEHVELFNGLRPLLQRPWELLVDLNIAIFEWMSGILGIKCRNLRASDLKVSGRSSDLLVNICKSLGASVYVSGEGARAYLEPDRFEKAGIEVRYQRYTLKPYRQCHSHLGFISGLSALDVVLNLGSEAAALMKAGRA